MEEKAREGMSVEWVVDGGGGGGMVVGVGMGMELLEVEEVGG